MRFNASQYTHLLGQQDGLHWGRVGRVCPQRAASLGSLVRRRAEDRRALPACGEQNSVCSASRRLLCKKYGSFIAGYKAQSGSHVESLELAITCVEMSL